jgi:hypothetical protein
MTQPTQTQIQAAVQELTPGATGSLISFDPAMTSDEQALITKVIDAALTTPAGEYVAYLFSQAMPSGDTVLITNKILSGESQFIPAVNATDNPGPDNLPTTFQLDYDFSDNLNGGLLFSTSSGNLHGTTTPFTGSMPTNEASDFFVADPVDVITHEFAHLSFDNDLPLGSNNNNVTIQNFLQGVGMALPDDSNSMNVDLTNIIKQELRNDPTTAFTFSSISPARGNYEDAYDLVGSGSTSPLFLFSANPNKPDAVMTDNSVTGALTITPSNPGSNSTSVTLDLNTYDDIKDNNGNVVVSLSTTIGFQPYPAGTLTYSPTTGAISYHSLSGGENSFSAPTGYSLSNIEVESVLSASGTPTLNFVQTLIPTSGGLVRSVANTFDAANNLTATTYHFTNGASYAFGTDTSTGLNYNSATGALTFNLMFPDPFSFGAVSVNPAAGASTLSLADGLVINLQSPDGFALTDPFTVGMTPEAVLLGYLSQLGDPLTADQLDQLNYAFLNPTGTSHVV